MWPQLGSILREESRDYAVFAGLCEKLPSSKNTSMIIKHFPLKSCSGPNGAFISQK